MTGSVPARRPLRRSRGRPMVEFVLAALRGTTPSRPHHLGRPGAPPPASRPSWTRRFVERGGLLENLAAGSHGARPGDRARPRRRRGPAAPDARGGRGVSSTRRSRWTPTSCTRVVPRADVVRAYPDARKTFVRLRDGVFTGGSAFVITPRAFARARPIIERAIAARKRPWRPCAPVRARRRCSALPRAASGSPRLEARVARIAGDSRARGDLPGRRRSPSTSTVPRILAMAERWLSARAAALHVAEEVERSREAAAAGRAHARDRPPAVPGAAQASFRSGRSRTRWTRPSPRSARTSPRCGSVCEMFELGRIETLAGAAAGSGTRPTARRRRSARSPSASPSRLRDPARILPGGFLYTTDLLSLPASGGAARRHVRDVLRGPPPRRRPLDGGQGHSHSP